MPTPVSPPFLKRAAPAPYIYPFKIFSDPLSEGGEGEGEVEGPNYDDAPLNKWKNVAACFYSSFDPIYTGFFHIR